MTCPKCGARMMEGAEMCVRCGTRVNNQGNARSNTYIVNGQVVDASRTILENHEYGRRRKNIFGQIFMLALLLGFGYLIITYFPVEDIMNAFNKTNDKMVSSIAIKTLTAAKEYYTNALWENGGQNLFGQEFDVHVLDEYIVGSKPESGSFVIVDDTEYGINLKDVVINGYKCNGTTQSLNCEKIIENNAESELEDLLQ